HPDRFGAFAALPMSSPAVAAEELRRAIEGLGLHGAMIQGHTRGTFLDDLAFDPVLAAAAALQVPIYLHPGPPPETVRLAYFNGLDPVAAAMLATAGWGWHAECGLHVLRMVLAGVFERHPQLTLITVESGVGWVPWMLEAMDHSYRAHHMWVRPVIPEPPSFYYRRNCLSTFTEDHAGLRLVEELDLVENFLWSNDYPHHEGTWPHSAEAIERTMGHLSDGARAKVLGLNAARLFGFEVRA
ncbi:MAG TPA: amidohydrolase family protein, partial [Methylomirabilota bacterium]|nr:amidohydrolase family protein [Methylomirabilota bacterium]